MLTDAMGREIRDGDLVLVICRVRNHSQPCDAPWLLLEFVRRAGWNGAAPTVFLPPDAVRLCGPCTAAAVGAPQAAAVRYAANAAAGAKVAGWLERAAAVPDPFASVPAC